MKFATMPAAAFSMLAVSASPVEKRELGGVSLPQQASSENLARKQKEKENCERQ